LDGPGFCENPGRFANYGNFHADKRRHEFDPVARQWEPPPPPAAPVPRGLPFGKIPGRERKLWFVFGGPGSTSDK
jgi:hypothetical protein